jgi:hypothetical protein
VDPSHPERQALLATGDLGGDLEMLDGVDMRAAERDASSID